MNDVASRFRRKTIESKQRRLRENLWPEIKDADLWDSKSRKGYKTIPRPMPYLLQTMDSLNKNKPVSGVYLDLWCRAFDQFFVVLNRPTEMAFASGFRGARAVSVWRERLDRLQSTGFIDIKHGPSGRQGYALILDPFKVVKRIHAKDKDAIPNDLYNAILERMTEIGADDLDP